MGVQTLVHYTTQSPVCICRCSCGSTVSLSLSSGGYHQCLDMYRLCLVWCLVLGLSLDMVSPHQVRLDQGWLQGVREHTTHQGRDIISYLGIPYGLPPVGGRRFSLPQPNVGWEGVMMADRQVKCPQQDILTDTILGEEDCLVVNVHVLEEVLRANNSSTPVLVFIHGGGFLFGDGTSKIFGPEWLLDFGIILVTINYRLGPLGFLSTGDQVLPANLGLWDQRLALQWIQHNIATFGGDPARVTIAGESAGSMSVMNHVISPQSQGLFQGAIAQSGVPDSRFCRTDRHPAFYARSLASALGCEPTLPSPELRSCLLDVPVERFILATKAWEDEGLQPLSHYFFKPVVDDFSPDPFLPKDPHTMLLNGEFNKVPLILGYNKDEGLSSFLSLRDKFPRANTVESLAFDLFAREPEEIDDIDREAVSLYLSEHFQNQSLSLDTKEKVIQMYTDAIFLSSIHNTANIISQRSPEPVYLYRYNYEGPVSLVHIFGGTPSWQLTLRIMANYVGLDIFSSSMGVAHADELFMMFKTEIPLEQRKTDTDVEVSESLIRLWTDFVKTGTPSQEWRQHTVESMEHFEIGIVQGMMQDPGEMERLELWRKLEQLIPPSLHLKRSPSWTNTLMYRDLSHLLASKEL